MRLAVGAGWLTEQVLVIPPPVTVTVPVLELEPVFAETVTLKEPLLLPEVGLQLIQLTLSETDHETLEETVIEKLSPPEGELCDVGDMVR